MTWEFPSSSSQATYTVTLTEASGLLSCTCKGWTFKRGDKPRKCKHIDDVILKHKLNVEVRGEYVFAVGLPVEEANTSNEELTSAHDSSIIRLLGDNEMATMTETATFEGMKASSMTGKFAHVANADGFIIPERFDQVFSTGEWAMDEKIDGHRCQIMKRGDVITTTLRSIPSLPDHIVSAIQKIPFDCHLDGELCIPGGVSTDVPNLALRSQMAFLAFDLLDVCGESTMHLPYAERRALLETLAVHLNGEGVSVVAQYEVSFAEVKKIWARSGEGCILKLKTSPYRPGYRGPEWVKVKALKQFVVTVTGFEAGSLGPTAVTLFQFDDGKSGRCKTLNNKELAETAANPESYIGRRLVIQCQQRTRGNSARHPMWDHWAGEAEA